MNHSEITLHPPAYELKEPYLNAYRSLNNKNDQLSWAYLGDKADIDSSLSSFNDYVDTLLERETSPPENFVADTIWWAIYEGQMIGRIAFRHTLNDFLKKVGGHVGYIVHPNWRNKGVATWMLGEVVKQPKLKKLDKILLTCDIDNIASEKTIISNGGVFDKIVNLGPDRPAKKHYWISLTDR